MRKVRRLVPAALLVAVLSACTTQPATHNSLVDGLTEVGVPDDDAQCVADRIFDDANFDQKQRDEIASALQASDLDQETLDKIDTLVSECQSGTGPSGTNSTTSSTSG